MYARPVRRGVLLLAACVCVSGFVTQFSGRQVRCISLAMRRDDMNDLRIDVTKLSPKEQERLAFIQKLTNEADEFAKAAGFAVDKEVEEKEVVDTKWSGQSDVEVSRVSKNTWEDMFARPVLLVGDVLALLVFAIIGRTNHGEGLDIASAVGTAAPFIISWVALSPLLGSFSRKATSSLKSIPLELALPWAVSMPAALALRGLLKGAVPPTPFIVITMVATLVLLSAWRAVYVSLLGETSDEEYRKAGSLEIFKMIGTLIRRW